MLSPGEKPVDGPFLRHITNQLSHAIGMLHAVETEYRRLSGCGREKSDQCAERGALAGAVRTEQAEDFAGVDLKGDVGDGVMTVIRFRQMGDIDRNRPVHHPQPFAP